MEAAEFRAGSHIRHVVCGPVYPRTRWTPADRAVQCLGLCPRRLRFASFGSMAARLFVSRGSEEEVPSEDELSLPLLGRSGAVGEEGGGRRGPGGVWEAVGRAGRADRLGTVAAGRPELGSCLTDY